MKYLTALTGFAIAFCFTLSATENVAEHAVVNVSSSEAPSSIHLKFQVPTGYSAYLLEVDEDADDDNWRVQQFLSVPDNYPADYVVVNWTDEIKHRGYTITRLRTEFFENSYKANELKVRHPSGGGLSEVEFDLSAPVIDAMIKPLLPDNSEMTIKYGEETPTHEVVYQLKDGALRTKTIYIAILKGGLGNTHQGRFGEYKFPFHNPYDWREQPQHRQSVSSKKES